MTLQYILITYTLINKNRNKEKDITEPNADNILVLKYAWNLTIPRELTREKIDLKNTSSPWVAKDMSLAFASIADRPY